MSMSRSTRHSARGLALVSLFVTQLLCAVLLHLDTHLVRRTLGRWASEYASRELRGTLHIGEIERLTTSSIWLREVALYDEQARQVVFLSRVRATSLWRGALLRWLFRQASLTVLLESLRVDGARLRLEPDPGDGQPSVSVALQPDPNQRAKRANSPSEPFRFFLPNVEIGDLKIESSLPGLSSQKTQVRSLSGQFLITDQGLAISLKRLSIDSPDTLALPLHAFGSLDYRSTNRAWGELQVSIGSIPGTVSFRYEKGVLKLSVFAPRINPSAARQLLEDWPVNVPMAVSLAADGSMQQLSTALELTAGTSRATVSGVVGLQPALRADLAVEGHGLELGTLLGLPVTTQLDTTLHAQFTLDEGQPHLRFDGVIRSGNIGRVAVPNIDLQGEYNAEGLLLAGRSQDPNLPIRGAAVLHDRELDVEAQADHLDLLQVLPTAINPTVNGTASVRAHAKLTHASASVNVDANLRDLRVARTELAQAAISVEAVGPIREPQLWTGKVVLLAQRLASPYLTLDQLRLEATGGAQTVHLTATGKRRGHVQLSFQSDLSPQRGFALDRSRLELVRDADHVSLLADSLAIGSDSVVVRGLRMDGTLGHAQGAIALQQDRIRATIESKALDLSALTRLLGVQAGLAAGNVAIRLALDTHRVPAQGELELDLERGSIASLHDLNGNLRAALSGEHLTAEVAASSDLVAGLRGQLDLMLAPQSSAVEKLLHATGSASFALTQLRLARLGTLLDTDHFKPKLSGEANLEFRAERSRAELPPDLNLQAQTNGFALSLPMTTGNAAIEGVELSTSTTIMGETSALDSRWQLLRDGQPKATLEVRSNLPPLQDLASLSRSWRQTPFEAILVLPQQRLDQLLSSFELQFGQGDAEFRLWLRGPLDQAHVVTQIRGSRLSFSPVVNPVPFDVEALLEYQRADGAARLAATIGAERTPWIEVHGLGNIVPCSSGLLGVCDWDGRLEIGVLGLALQALPRLPDLGFSGNARGLLSVQRSQAMTSVDGVIPIDQLRIHEQPLGQALIHVRTDHDNLVAGAKLMDGGAQIELEADVPVQWSEPLPRRRTDVQMRLAATASGYDASIASPWLDRSVTGLGGELNGRVDLTYGAPPMGAHDPAAHPSLTLGGYLTLTHGKATLRDLGLSLNDISLAAQASSTSTRTTVSIPSLSASIGEQQGRLSGSMVAELEGLALKRLTARIDQAQNVPLTVNSMNLASISCVANVELSPRTSGWDIDIGFDDLEVHLPRRGSRQIVGLSENPDIVVVQPLGSDAWQRARSSLSPEYRVRLNLGRKTRVSRNDFTLPISGTPELDVGRRLRPSGTIQLEPLGRIELFGKSFVIDRGHVTLDPEQPSNPQLDVMATWRGPTHQVTVQIQGVLSEARLRLSSDPPLASEAQVMALLLGGGSGDDSTASAGLGVGATLFNEVLSDTPLSSLEVRTSSNDRHANYTAAVPIRENLWFEATYQTPSGTNAPGSTVQSGFSGTVDYRFRRNWSVRTEVGTLGAGADLMWQYRY